jgi:hypothetical protein
MCILMILYVEMKLQVIHNSNKLRYCFNAIVLSFQCQSSEYKPLEYIILNNFMLSDDFVCWNEDTNYSKNLCKLI